MNSPMTEISFSDFAPCINSAMTIRGTHICPFFAIFCHKTDKPRRLVPEVFDPDRRVDQDPLSAHGAVISSAVRSKEQLYPSET